LGSLLTFAAYAHRKKLGRDPERPLSSSSPFSSRSQRMSAIRPRCRRGSLSGVNFALAVNGGKFRRSRTLDILQMGVVLIKKADLFDDAKPCVLRWGCLGLWCCRFCHFAQGGKIPAMCMQPGREIRRGYLAIALRHI
jgi:hypothetical protein